MTDPISTPAQMREAAAKIAHDVACGRLHIDDAADLIRALPVAEPEPQAVRVKPLQWVFHDATRNYSAVYISDGWTISRKGTGHFVLYNREFNEGMDRAYQTLEDAQAAAEADHASRVLSQIEAVPAAQVRAEALRDGYDAGFAATTVGWNAEFGPEQTGYVETYVDERERIIGAMDRTGGCGPSLISAAERKSIQNRALEEAAKLAEEIAPLTRAQLHRMPDRDREFFGHTFYNAKMAYQIATLSPQVVKEASSIFRRPEHLDLIRVRVTLPGLDHQIPNGRYARALKPSNVNVFVKFLEGRNLTGV